MVGFFRALTNQRTSTMWMGGKISFQKSLRGGITFFSFFFFLVPQIRRGKETVMVAQKEEVDSRPVKKKPMSLRDIHGSS